jgi:type IV secretory pathway VirB10-like protein
MHSYRFIRVSLLTVSLAGVGSTQEAVQSTPAAVPSPERTIALTVPKDTPLEIALDKEVHVKEVGQEIHGRLVQPVYAFDRLVAPVGTDVKGRIAKIDPISSKRRVFGILNGDFTPPHNVQVEFTELQLKDGTQIPFQATITPGSGQSIQLVSAKDDSKKKGLQDAAAKRIDEAKQEARQKWNDAMKQVKEPGKLHRLEQYAVAQLPVRPQYIHSGTIYFAALDQPLNFGSEPLTAQMMSSVGTPPPAGSLVHALLVTPLNSATTLKGAEVEAVLSQPLFDGDRLILPEGSRLKGSVVQVRPASRFHHNGQLRIIFRELVPPDGIQQRIVSNLESVQSGKNEHVTLDSEGGAEATSPKTRYLSTGLTIALAFASTQHHTDADDAATGGGSGNGVAGGTAGFRLVGMALGLLVRSQPVGMAMGAYGSARSVYSNFISKGHEVVFPKNTPMEISIGAPRKPVMTAPEASNTKAEQKQ